MRIKIEHISNTYNYGSLMMAVNTICFIKDIIDDVIFYVDNENINEINRIKSETNYDKILPQLIYNKSSPFAFMRFIYMFKREYFEKKYYDVRIVLGGDDISEYYGKKWIYKFALMYLKNRHVPTIYLGQTMGPFTSWRKYALKYVIGKSPVFTRDDLNYTYLQSLHIENLNKGSDLAFAKLPNQDNIFFDYDEINLVQGKYIVVVPSGLIKSYTKYENNYITEYCAIIISLLENIRFKDYRIVLLAHVLCPKEVDDRNVINSIKNFIDIKYLERITILDQELLASEARYVLGNSKFVITGRMHAAVSSFFANTPAVSLSYSVKYNGVIGEELNMKDLIVECGDDEMWSMHNVQNQVVKKCNYIMDNYEKIVNIIEKNVYKACEKNYNQLKNVSKILGGYVDKQ